MNVREQLKQLVQDFDAGLTLTHADTIMGLRAIVASKWQMHVLEIEHKYGRALSVHLDHEAAYNELWAWCEASWDDACAFSGETKPMPEDDDEAIGEYFDMVDESWSIEACIIGR